MADFERAIPIILKHEGGFVDHPADPGGATNRGIIFSLYKQYAKALELPDTVDGLKNLTEDQAKFIYKGHFWDKMRGDDFKSQAVADIVFDGYVNMGNKALKLLQVELGIGTITEVDGIIGPMTLSILNFAAPEVVFEGYKDTRIQFYQDLAVRKPKLQVFLKGWLNRINSFNYRDYQTI